MPYVDPETRRERRRDYMRDFMRRKRAGAVSTRMAAVSTPDAVSSRAAVSSGKSVSFHATVSSPEVVSTAASVSTPVSTLAGVRTAASSRAPDRPTVIFRPFVHKPTGITPVVKAQAKKVYNLLVNGRSLGERSAARQRLQEIVQKAGVPAADLMSAIGAPPDALERPVV